MQVNNVQNISAAPSQSLGILDAVSEFSFWDTLEDVVDVINPLQHIPVVSSLYRAATGDAISSVANVVGSTLFGGPIGGAVALASEIVDGFSGELPPVEAALVKNDFQDISKAKFASNAYESNSKMRVTTEDWLNPNFNSVA